jgi:hypothetical protein
VAHFTTFRKVKWLYFLLSHSIFVAICAAAISYQTLLICPFPFINHYTMAFIFFATITSYNVYWLLSKKIKFTHIFTVKKNNILFITVSFITAIICLLLSTLNTRLVLPAVVLYGLYMLPLLPFKPLAFTKKLGFLKTILLAFTWTYVTVVLPLNKPFFLLGNEKLLLFFYRFSFMFLLCLMFDNRDAVVDKIKGLHSLSTDTHPLLLKMVIGISFAAMACCIFLMHSFGLSISKSFSLILSAIALLVLYFLSLKKQGYLFYYFFVDGLMLFSAIATYIASIC